MTFEKMIRRHVASIIVTVCLLSGCNDSVPLNYPTRAEAEAESLFARGWLPDIIPSSSRNISMSNDLDLNISNGEFNFDAGDHDGFVAHLERATSLDVNGSAAYIYNDWTFWIDSGKSHCRFYMSLTRSKKPSEQGGAHQPPTRSELKLK